MRVLRPPNGSLAVAITSHTENRKCTLLRQVLLSIATWPMQTSITIYTNNRGATRKCVGTTATVSQVTLPPTRQFKLAHAYKSDWTRLVNSAHPPHSFAYLEDDMIVSARAFTSWYRDSELLRKNGYAAQGYIRAFQRFEYSHGTRVLVDASAHVKVDPAKLLNISGIYFAAMPNPYCAVYFGFHEQVRSWASDKRFWALHNDKYGVREFAANGIHFAAGLHKVVVPVYLSRSGGWRLSNTGLIHHSSNKYAALKDSRYGTIAVNDVFTPSRDTSW